MHGVASIIYLASVCQAVATLIISWVTIACPSATGPISHLSLLTVAPSSPTGLGPRLWVGLFASCVERATNQQTDCTTLSFKLKTNYDVSALPPNAPSFVLEDPPIIIKVLVCISLGLSHFFLVLVLWNALRVGQPVRYNKLEKSLLRFPTITTVGILLIITGLVNFCALQLFFDLVRDNFNEFVRLQGGKGPDLVASRGQAFLWAYWGYGLAGIPLLVASMEGFYGQNEPPAAPAPDPAPAPKAKASKEIYDIDLTGIDLRDSRTCELLLGLDKTARSRGMEFNYYLSGKHVAYS